MMLCVQAPFIPDTLEVLGTGPGYRQYIFKTLQGITMFNTAQETEDNEQQISLLTFDYFYSFGSW